MDALFELDGPRLVPTELARGPWSPDALHGGPTAAAVARAAEQHLALTGPGEVAWELARVTVELVRPVPLEPLLVTARTTRPGRKVTLVGVSIAAGEGDAREVARGVALGIRREAQDHVPVLSLKRPGPEEVATTTPPAGANEWVAFHNSGVEMRWVAGVWRQPGPATVWGRLRVPVVAGEETSPVVRAAALADFGNGISSELDFGKWRFLNPDLSVHLARPPVGEWICLDARTVLGNTGAGLAESSLSDGDGIFGRAVQSLLIERAD
jgi:acyl-coenzyme A thioesterase PaaI-like protein